MKKLIMLCFILAFLFSAFLLGGCTKEAEAQDLLTSQRMVNFGDTTLTVSVAPHQDVYITFADSSNSTVDTFKVYIVNTAGQEVLAALIKYNDTTANSLQVPKSTGTVFPGDGTIGIYKVQYPSPYKVKIVRTNVASISGTPVTGKVSVVTVQATRPTGYSGHKDQENWRYEISYNNKIILPIKRG